ncbi:MucB/RseB C-terminal domain-containing protein [Variovorax sp. HJSM1_2]|uniref:MucB/RseB C-terminal domain-containing protein n=1 Tax=Variovorax sp. HJSM1_2 TaxID=3366263 RepID=UPI003BEA786B
MAPWVVSAQTANPGNGSFWPASAPAAEARAPVASEATESERGVAEWLLRMHEASRKRDYIGTFVVSSGMGNLSSARIWHACEGEDQVERMEALTGAPRTTFRRNNQVVTLLPDSKVAVMERRDSLGLFTNLLQSSGSAIPSLYTAKRIGRDRVAGYDADVVLLKPRDALRYGYRIWSEKKSGLVVKLQTLDGKGKVLEQAEFSELQIDAPVRIDKLTQMMANTNGYKIQKIAMTKTTALEEGWVLKNDIPGFQPLNCYRRQVSATQPELSNGTLQWIFSDGLASVSLFVEAFDPQRHLQSGYMALGATQSLSVRNSDWWVTIVGEVPPRTLESFARALERKN